MRIILTIKPFLPMKKVFTQQQTSMTTTSVTNHCTRHPRKQTVAFIKQFARAYCPVANAIPGVILN